MDRPDDLAAQLASTLDWWAQAGVDVMVQDEPRAWLAAPPVPAPVPEDSMAQMPAARANSVPPPPAPVESLPGQLDLFEEWLRTSATLPYAAPGAPRVCPSGDPSAGLMVIAPMPSSQDCAAGTLVSGEAGGLFDRMLTAIGRSRETIYLTGLSCLRPTSGRFDRAGAERCAAIARHHIGLAAPKAVLLLGQACAQALLGLGIAQARGRVHQLETPQGPVPAIASFTPDYLLDQPGMKAKAWGDLKLLMTQL